jgi:hypothetical protein
VRGRLGGRDWRETRVAVERATYGVRLQSIHDGQGGNLSTSHRFEVRAPRKFNVRLRSAGGGLSITGVEGEFHGSTGGGDLTLSQLRGRASLSTGGGEIAVSDSDLRGSVSTGGGEVRLSRVRGGLRGSSGSGPVIYAESGGDEGDETGDLDGVTTHGSQIELDPSKTVARGAIHAEKAGGEIVLTEAPNGASLSTGGGDIRVGRGGGLIKATTGGGDIEIGPVAGSVTARTGAGEVHVSLSPTEHEQEVTVVSGLGRVIVDLPASFDGRFELETAYTRPKSPTRIECPWPLEHEPTTDWDSRKGTPRRYVRAHGTVGQGKGLVRVYTVNGDVVIRRGR